MPARPTSPAALSRSTLLADIPATGLRALLAHAARRTYRAGQRLFDRGDAADGLYALISGEVRVIIAGPDGADVTLANFRAGEVLGELSVLDGRPRSASAVASDVVETLFIESARVREWLVEHPDAAVRMLAELAGRLRDTDERIAEIALLSVEARLARRLWQRFVEESGTQPGAVLKLNQRELASSLGATRESVNRQLARLKSDGVIEVDGTRIVLRRPEALTAFADAL